MRIISGKYKGRKLNGFDIEGTRPTMDRVKESLFAMIASDIKQKKCLDLYAGSGSLGIEALSNGAFSCLFVDQNKIVIKTLKENTKNIDGATIIETNALELHKKIKDSFDIVFLDPPYHLKLIEKTLNYLLNYHFLNEEALIICEYEEENFSNDSFDVIKEKKYGSKNIKILKKRKDV